MGHAPGFDPAHEWCPDCSGFGWRECSDVEGNEWSEPCDHKYDEGRP